MEGTKLTVRIDRQLIQNAKQFAKEHGTTLTNLITAYLARVPVQKPFGNAPIVASLAGTLSQDVSRDDYRKHLDEKYGHA